MNVRLIFLALLFIGNGFSACCPHSTPGTRIEIKYQGPNGIGYDESYATLAAFITPNDCCDVHPFLDLQGHLFHNGRFAANAGGGLRAALDCAIVGFNVYYDYRNSKELHSLHQVGAGFEWLGKCFDFRLNGYAPLEYQKQANAPCFLRFEGHTGFAKQKIRANFPMIDYEVGFCPFPKRQNFTSYLAFGQYYLFERSVGRGRIGREWGVRGRLAIDACNGLRFGGEVSYDPFFDVRGHAFIEYSIPLGKVAKQKNARCCPLTCLTQPVIRTDIIPVGEKKVKFDILICEPNKKIFFVDNTASDGGTGTFEKPFNDLLLAEGISLPGDIIYVFPGDGTSTGQDSGFIMKEDQRLIGSAATFKVCDVCVPVMTPNTFPLIENTNRTRDIEFPSIGVVTAGFGVQMAQNTEVAGLHIDGANLPVGAVASVGADLVSGTDFIIRKNRFTGQFGISIYREDPLNEGTVKVICNTIEELNRIINPAFDPGGISFLNSISNSLLCFKENIIQNLSVFPLSTGIGFFGDITNTRLKFCKNFFDNMNLAIHWQQSTIANSTMNLCQNNFDDTTNALFFRLVAITNSSLNLCDNIFVDPKMTGPWVFFSGGSLLNSGLHFCTNTFEDPTFSDSIAIAWSDPDFITNCTFHFCENTIGNFGQGVLWQNAPLDNCTINFCDNALLVNLFAVSWDGSSLNNCNVKFCNNIFNDAALGISWSSSPLTSCVLNFFNNCFTDFSTAIRFSSSALTNSSVNFCKNSFVDGTTAITSTGALVDTTTVCVTENTFTGITTDFDMEEVEGSTFCVENNQFDQSFSLSTSNAQATSCLRLVGNSMQAGGAFSTTENGLGTFDVERLSQLSSLNNGADTSGVNGTDVNDGACGCNCSCSCECTCTCDCDCDCDIECDCIDPCEKSKGSCR